MPVKQTNLFQKIQIHQPTKDEQAYKWLCQHHLAGYDGKYNLYSKEQLYKLIQWDMLYGNHSAETKEHLIKIMKKLRTSHDKYFHYKAITTIIGYTPWLLIKIYTTEKQREH